MAQLTPIVYDDSTGEHRPAGSGEQVGVTYVPIDPSGDNVIRQTVNGLMVSAADLPAPLSAQPGNYLRYGNDRGLFCDGNDVLSNADDNLLRIDSIDRKVKITAADIKAAAGTAGVIVSGDAGNVISAGSDGGAYLDASSVQVDISTQADNLLTRDSSNALLVSAGNVASGVRSPAADNLITTDASGRLQVNPAAAVSSLRSAEAGNLIGTDPYGKMLLTADGLRSGDGNNALVTGTDGKLYVRTVNAASVVDGNDKLLVISNDGSTVSTVLNMSYNQTSGLLSLIGKNGQTVATATVQSSGSVLESAAIVVNPAGQPAGTYLAMTFRLADGTLSTVYADLSALSDVYTAGAGIDITNYVISVKLDSTGGLTTTANGVAVDTSALAPGMASDLISSDSGNMIGTGSDGLLYAPLDCGEL